MCTIGAERAGVYAVVQVFTVTIHNRLARASSQMKDGLNRTLRTKVTHWPLNWISSSGGRFSKLCLNIQVFLKTISIFGQVEVSPFITDNRQKCNTTSVIRLTGLTSCKIDYSWPVSTVPSFLQLQFSVPAIWALSESSTFSGFNCGKSSFISSCDRRSVSTEKLAFYWGGKADEAVYWLPLLTF